MIRRRPASLEGKTDRNRSENESKSAEDDAINPFSRPLVPLVFETTSSTLDLDLSLLSLTPRDLFSLFLLIQTTNHRQVRLKDHGTELIEVADNGSGVKRSDRPALALKHHTSKLRSFLDLDRGPSSFGFRGEALSSLCAVAAEVAIVTRCDDDDEEGEEGG